MQRYLLAAICVLMTMSVYSETGERKASSEIGTSDDDVPCTCTCIFNKNRMWSPEKIVWNNEEGNALDIRMMALVQK